ncbi:DNA adenine methylase [Streptomyces zaomyceticus]|uniref:DNA adenine methylase n=1 Tax=Streptomyces zaomyceticus TaxID=68286 RepID=UPI00343D4D68
MSMKYLGGKSRIASHVERLVSASSSERGCYIEPFVGGAATFSRLAPHFQTASGYDVVPDLVMMWQAAIDGWTPPTELSVDEYTELRTAEPSPLRGFAGFGCSYGGKWFGGYARDKTGRVGRDGLPYSEVRTSARTVTRQAAQLRNATVTLADYRDVLVPRDAVVYADPPYAGTTGYEAADPFDTAEFWKTAEGWATGGATVLVSEHCAPAPWVRVWEKPYASYLRGDQKPGFRTEAVFMLPDAAARVLRDAA